MQNKGKFSVTREGRVVAFHETLESAQAMAGTYIKENIDSFIEAYPSDPRIPMTKFRWDKEKSRWVPSIAP